MRNNRYSIRRNDGDVQQRFVANVPEFIDLLEGPFGIRVPRSPKLEEKLAVLIEANPSAAKGGA
jgi:hypothetical protein